MAYFVTGATGFIGRYLVQELVDNREGEIFVLCREGSLARLEPLIEEWTANGGDRDRVTPVIGDLGEPDLGVSHQWITAHTGEIEHFFHLAAIYDMTASDERNETMNVGGTRNAVGLAGKLEAGHFHQVSSVAASGDFRGVFDESMFDEGQRLPSPYHRTKFESEKIVREECRGAVAGLPAGDRGRALRDRRDGQDRRPLLLLPAAQADARHPPRLGAAGRRGPRRHQRGAGRLRRQGDGPHRPRARPRRPGLPPGQPRAA